MDRGMTDARGIECWRGTEGRRNGRMELGTDLIRATRSLQTRLSHGRVCGLTLNLFLPTSLTESHIDSFPHWHHHHSHACTTTWFVFHKSVPLLQLLPQPVLSTR